MQEFKSRQQIESRKARKIVTQIMCYFKLKEVDKIKIQYDGDTDNILFMILMNGENTCIIEHPKEKNDERVIWFDARIQRPGYMLTITDWGKNAIYECTFFSGKFSIESKKDILSTVVKAADFVSKRKEEKVGELFKKIEKLFEENHIVRFSSLYRE